MKISLQGNRGSFSEVIASRVFNGADMVACKTFAQVFESVESGEADRGVIPIENSLTGRINVPTNLLISSGLKVCGEGSLRIIHCLIGNRESSVKSLGRIYAHPEALAQCGKFLEGLDCEQVSWQDGASAAGIVKKDKGAGLIASERVANLYGLKVLKRGVQDYKDNLTRFLMISKRCALRTGSDKTFIVFSTKHKPGALLHALEVFAKENINLTRLESMPSKSKPWEYMFLVDFEGHRDDARVKKTLNELKNPTNWIKIIGSYPRGGLYE
jgi:prephenate dehydratase